MTSVRHISVAEKSSLFDRTGMFYKKFPSDFRQIRYFTLLVLQKAPPEIKEINLLEQQISELIKNAVKHGNKKDPSKSVHVWFAFDETSAHVIVQDEGEGFARLEEWNDFNRRRTECFQRQDFEEMANYVSFITPESDEQDSGNALFAAVEYWDAGLVFNGKKNCVAAAKHFPHRRHGISLSDN
ncbi:MAG TPA: ATP-binding protein [Spirochaetia bacterium]|nr:ATP-binding protein [Spirochaetia bacterium]